MRGEEEEFLNHRFHRLHRLGNGFGVSAGDTMGGKRLVSCHVPREGLLTEVADTTFYAAKPSLAATPNHFLSLCNLWFKNSPPIAEHLSV
jgi:hypothetical protein